MIRTTIFVTAFVVLSAPAYAGFEFTPPPKSAQQQHMGDKVMPPPLPAPLVPIDQMDLGADVPLPPSAPQAGMKSLTMTDEKPEGVMIRRQRPAMTASSPQGWAKAQDEKPIVKEEAPAPQAQAAIPSPPPVEEEMPMPVDGMDAPPLPEPPQAESAMIPESDVYIEPQPIQPIQPVADQSVLEGFGREVPLALALQQIVPAGYAYAIAPNVNGGVALSWSGGKSWIVELNQALASHGYNASVRGRTVMITAPSTIAAFPATPIADSSFNSQPMPIQEPQMLSDTQDKRVWQAQPGDSLRRILTDWSSSAGVQLYWPDESDYVLTKPIRVKGTYAEAVDAVLTSLSGVSPRPMAKLHTNKNAGAPVLAIQES